MEQPASGTPKYRYEVVDASGKKRYGWTFAEHAGILRQELVKQKFKVIKIRRIRPHSRRVLVGFGILAICLVSFIVWRLV